MKHLTTTERRGGSFPRRRLGRRAALAVVLVGSPAACGDDDPDEAEADAAACEDFAALAAAVDGLVALNPSIATGSDYSDAADDVRSARDSFNESMSDVTESDWQDLERDVDGLVDQLGEAPDDQAVADVLSSARPQAVQVRTDLATFGTVLCSIGPATSTPTS